MNSFTFTARLARRIPDPIFATSERHIFLCAVEDLPQNLPRDPNPRHQNTNRRIYREIEEHLLNDEGNPNTFHLKNKGITILATKVTKVSEEKYEVEIKEGEGIVDGAHSYDIIIKNQGEIIQRNRERDDPIRQFVKIEILTGIDATLAPEIAGGLNTAIQVQQMSLANLADKFAWIKEILDSEPYGKEIAYREGETDTQFDVRDILVLLELFNITEYPNEKSHYPIRAYTSKEGVLDNYLKNAAPYERLAPILKDILYLHDLISIQARKLHKGKGASLAFVEKCRRGAFTFSFSDESDEYRLTRGALFPMLGAFRWMVHVDPESNQVGWKGGFIEVQTLWKTIGADLMQATQGTSTELGRNPNAIGKSRNHWANLHNLVAKQQLMSQK